MNANEMHDTAAPETPVRDLRRDIGGLVLFALAIFMGVSVVMAARRPDPTAGGTTAVFMGLVGWLGVWAPILLAGCLGLLGARLWVAGAAERLARNAAWSLVLALACALLLGAASAGAGGAFGELTGGNLAGMLPAWVAVPAALAVLAGVVWLAWLRPPEWKPVLSPGEPAPSIYTPTDSEGLTADEAEALLPEQITGRSIPVAPDLPPLYPPDVRREGLIPEGARALEPRDEPAPRILPDAPAAPALADAAARVAVQPLAQPAGGLAHQAAALPVQPPAQPAAAPGGGSALADLAPAVPRWERPRDLAPAAAAPESAPAAVPPAGAGFHISVLPVRSAWESEDEADEGDEEDEDDVEADEAEVLGERSELRADDAHDADDDSPDEEDELEEEEEEDEDELTAGVEAEDDGDATDDDEADDEDSEVVAPKDAEPSAEQDEADVVEEDLDEDAWSDDGDAEVLTAAVEDAPLASDPELSADVASAALGAAEVVAESAPPGRPGWEQGGLFDDEPVDAYGTPMTLVEALRQANQETSTRLGDVVEPAEAAVATATTESAELAAHSEPVTEPEPAVASSAAPEDVEPPIEPQVELQPQPRAAARAREAKSPKAPKQPAPAAPAPAPDEPDDLVFRAGMLFLERGRVAVSMLQRSFDLDFKEATALLDQLQQAGLIGPYLGGQKRDILLSADEWRQRRVLAR